MITLVVLLCIAVIALVAWITSSLLGEKTSAGAQKVQVPGVTGKTLAAAKASLEESGLKYKIDPVPCQPGENGAAARCTADDIDKVFAIDPAAGTSVPKLTEITLTYGTSPDQIAVPDVAGLSPQEAQAKLSADGWGFAQGTDTVEVDDTTKVGKVAQQNPQAGVKAAKGAVITVLLGKGPDTVQLADVTGQPVGDAKATLEAAGFKVGTKEADSAKEQGEVLSMIPNPGRVAKGSTVTLTVSKGNQLAMPDITGLSVDQAKSKLNQQGWIGELTTTEKTTTSDISKNGKILTQDPKAGTQITTSQRVNITIGEFKISPSN
jgi:serine/threonine-protein kinase